MATTRMNADAATPVADMTKEDDSLSWAPLDWAPGFIDNDDAPFGSVLGDPLPGPFMFDDASQTDDSHAAHAYGIMPASAAGDDAPGSAMRRTAAASSTQRSARQTAQATATPRASSRTRYSAQAARAARASQAGCALPNARTSGASQRGGGRAMGYGPGGYGVLPATTSPSRVPQAGDQELQAAAIRALTRQVHAQTRPDHNADYGVYGEERTTPPPSPAARMTSSSPSASCDRGGTHDNSEKEKNESSLGIVGWIVLIMMGFGLLRNLFT